MIVESKSEKSPKSCSLSSSSNGCQGIITQQQQVNLNHKQACSQQKQPPLPQQQGQINNPGITHCPVLVEGLECNDTAPALEPKVAHQHQEWTKWYHQQEFLWHEKLREREAAAMRALQEQALEKDKERAQILEASRREYTRLEARLRKALSAAEQRERKMQDEEATRQSQHKSKMAEIEFNKRFSREEVKHSMQIEVRLLSFLSYQILTSSF